MDSHALVKAIFFSKQNPSKYVLDSFVNDNWLATGANHIYDRNPELAVKLAMTSDDRGCSYAIEQLQIGINDLAQMSISEDGIYSPEIIKAIEAIMETDIHLLDRIRSVL